jgi:hypothetical protein
VAPTTQLGFPPPAAILDPLFISKIPPKHSGDALLNRPRFMSAGSIGHKLPPNDIDTDGRVEHARRDEKEGTNRFDKFTYEIPKIQAFGRRREVVNQELRYRPPEQQLEDHR